MSDIIGMVSDNIIQILTAIITGIVGYLGIKIKKIIEDYLQTKLKKEIIEKTVVYVEQIGEDLTCDEKKKKATEKALEWMKEKKINISDTELEILVESAVKCLK